MELRPDGANPETRGAKKTQLNVKGYGRERAMEKNQEESKLMSRDLTGRDQGTTDGRKMSFR